MGESPYKDPLDIAEGLRELARFLKSAGFPQAGILVRLAARTAEAQIAQAQAKARLSSKRKPAAARKRRRGAEIVSLAAHRRR